MLKREWSILNLTSSSCLRSPSNNENNGMAKNDLRSQPQILGIRLILLLLVLVMDLWEQEILYRVEVLSYVD